MEKFKRICVIPLFFLVASLFAQQYSTGAILDPALYSQVDSKPVLLTRNYTSVPSAVSLKQYSPVPESQGQYGTCTGWAVAFAARTISESAALSRTEQRLSSNSAFSPIEAYLGSYMILDWFPRGYEYSSFARILDYLKSIDRQGSYVFSVLDHIKNSGAVRRLETERSNMQLILLSSYLNLQRFRISDYVTLFDNPFGTSGTVEERVPPVKKSLAEGKPVVIAMITPASFHLASSVWRPYENPGSGNHGAHAMCVISYDDDMYGGAFEIQNSWGTGWGNGGYIWITYNDFARWVYEAYEIIENLTNYKDAARYAASIEIEVYNSRDGMSVTYDSQGFYKTRQSYPSGTEFRFLMTNRYPAYVYAFAGDSSTSTISRIFPGQGVSPVLDYIDSTIAWPGENLWIRMDDTDGTDYLIVLYSKEALDINAIEQRFAGESGTFPERVACAVGNNFIPYNAVQYNNDRMEFSAVSTNPSSVFGLLLAIDHRAR